MADAQAKHVFISHASHDNEAGRRVTEILEGAGIKCWFSSRPADLEPGKEWDDNIVAALDQSDAVLLLFSAASNASKWVKRELAMASSRSLVIYPIRIEDVRPTGGMEAYLISVQWTDVFDDDFEAWLAPIITKLGGRVAPKGSLAAIERVLDEKYEARPRRKTKRTSAVRTERLVGEAATPYRSHRAGQVEDISFYTGIVVVFTTVSYIIGFTLLPSILIGLSAFFVVKIVITVLRHWFA